jgi:hypothetical protein
MAHCMEKSRAAGIDYDRGERRPGAPALAKQRTRIDGFRHRA